MVPEHGYEQCNPRRHSQKYGRYHQYERFPGSDFRSTIRCWSQNDRNPFCCIYGSVADVVNNDDDDDDDDDNSGSSAAPAVDWTDVSNSVQDKVAEMMKNPAIASVNMNFVCSGEVKVPQNVLNTIKGTKLTVAFHSGNGVALSISGQDSEE